MQISELRSILEVIGVITAGSIIIYSNIIKKKEEKLKDQQIQREKERIEKTIDMKFQGVEELTRKEMELKEEKIKEQLRILREMCDIYFHDLLILCVDFFEYKKDTIEYKCIESDLNTIRELLSGKMREVIYNNNIASRTNSEWESYKRNKVKYIFFEIEKILNQINYYNMINSKDSKKKLDFKDKIEFLSYNMMFELFDKIRCVSIEFTNEIRQTIDLLRKMKENK